MTAKVSVVIPCYNSAAFLAETVASVAAQSLQDHEIVLVDDGSSDHTPALIAHLAADSDGDRIITASQTNQGVASARNRGVALARGRYILPLDADDVIVPTMLAACARILDEEPQTALVFTDREDFGALSGVVASGRFELQRLKYFNQIPYCSMYRRELWTAIDGYRANVSGFDDWDFWLAAAVRGARGHHVAQPLLRHRRHRDSQLGTTMRDYQRLYATIILNHREAYAPDEVSAAKGYLEKGKPAALLQLSQRIFERSYRMPPPPGPPDFLPS
jgi:glycosyltransferase involved in cell wall biosynthesis